MERKRLVTLWTQILLISLAFGEVFKYWSPGRVRRLDFNIYYEAVTSKNLYDYLFPGFDLGFTYPTGAALFMSPFTWFGHYFAEHSWLVASAICGVVTFVGIGRLLVKSERIPDAWVDAFPYALACGGLLTMPVFLTIRYGQINLFIGALLFADLWALANKKKWAGVGIGVAAAIKLTPLLFVPVFIFHPKTRRAAATALGSFAAFTAASYVARPGDTERYWTEMLPQTDRIGRLSSYLNRGIRRPISWLRIGEGPETLLWLVCIAVIIGLVILSTRHLVDSGRLVDWFVLIVATSYVVSPITWGHHMTYAAPMLVIAWLRFPSRTGRVLTAIGALLAFDPFGFGHGRFSSFFQGIFALAFVVAISVQAIRSAGGLNSAMRALLGSSTSVERPLETSSVS